MTGSELPLTTGSELPLIASSQTSHTGSPARSYKSTFHNGMR